MLPEDWERLGIKPSRMFSIAPSRGGAAICACYTKELGHHGLPEDVVTDSGRQYHNPSRLGRSRLTSYGTSSRIEPIPKPEQTSPDELEEDGLDTVGVGSDLLLRFANGGQFREAIHTLSEPLP
ncbi:hypothetical protein A5640_18720 [Mycobacterium asiaticum]|uniref:Uncharacterized protein n=1 Tax=Mycobacterium asiaticum TaxID=1790 RepID=A0A1A3KG01_MYCAS|nr:hypothetical protein A5640_18720 [Mycobacterium asiaticum]